MARAGDIIRIWHWPLDADPDRLSRLRDLLTPEEQARADRYVTPLLRSRAVSARAGLRIALGRVLNRPPTSLAIVRGEHGKPFLGDAGPMPHFNLSHSGGHALLGVSAHARIGVDLEQLRPMPAELLTMLAPAEAAWIAAHDGADQAQAFFECWTKKEAFAKATGLGLSLPFGSFDVISRPGCVDLLAPAPEATRAAAGRFWRIRSLGVLADCHASVALESEEEPGPMSMEQLV